MPHFSLISTVVRILGVSVALLVFNVECRCVSATESADAKAENAEPAVPSARDLPDYHKLRVHAPFGRGRIRSWFPWIRFGIVLVAACVWLRAMRLCVDDARDYDLDEGRWSAWLFFAGLAGILIAIVIPAYLLGAGILLVACLVPFIGFVRWRNRSVPGTVKPMGWKSLFFRPAEFYRPSRRADGRLKSEPSKDSKMTSDNLPDVVLLGNTLTSRDTDARLTEHARHSQGFRSAMQLIEQAVTRRATDLHIHTAEQEVTVRMRVDGELRQVDSLDTDTGLSTINVIKVLADLDIADRRRSQDGSFRAEVDGRRLNFRVSSQGIQTGEKLSLRILDPAQHLATFWSLGMPQPEYEKLMAVLSRSQGMVLFAGATGAGKSTSAYAALRTLDAKSRNIVTVEDPIEYQIPDVDQIEVNLKAGQSFQTALRSLLRHDTDVVLIGEVRDEETAQIACQAATTGQLVISTLHANDTVTGLFRLNELGIEPYITASAVRAVISQQLVRLLCPQCRVSYKPSEKTLESVGLAGVDGATYFRAMDPNVNSCLTCNGRGFLGRTGVFEYLEVTPAIRDMVRRKVEAPEIRRVALEQGMTSLWENGLRLVKQGVVSIAELEHAVERME